MLRIIVLICDRFGRWSEQALFERHSNWPHFPSAAALQRKPISQNLNRLMCTTNIVFRCKEEKWCHTIKTIKNLKLKQIYINPVFYFTIFLPALYLKRVDTAKSITVHFPLHGGRAGGGVWERARYVFEAFRLFHRIPFVYWTALDRRCMKVEML